MQQKSRRSAIDESEQYVSRSAYKLDSIAKDLEVEFAGRVVLDVGSSTGGFSDYALKHGAAKVVAVEKGTNQLNPILKLDPKLELHEKTDIRNFKSDEHFDIILIDVSFISLRAVLPSIIKLADNALIIAMAKPQFETNNSSLMHQGVIKNERIRRELLYQLEQWLKPKFVILNKADSKIAGAKGNQERFYKLARSK